MIPAKTRRVLSISTLWPNATNMRFGTFVARSIEALQRETHWEPVVINPIGLPPVAIGRYKALEKALIDRTENDIDVYRPRFRLIPKIGAKSNPKAIAEAVIPLAKKLHAQTPFDLIDTQFFWPDGPATAMIAEALGLPFSIKARGSDIHFWGEQAMARGPILAAADKAAGLLSVCEALARDMGAMGMDERKITVHYTGLDRDRFRPHDHAQLRLQLGQEFGIPLSSEDQLLVTVGALIERKGQELVIPALPDLPKARLLLIGKGEDEGKLRAMARHHGVADRVHFMGLLDHDMIPLILSAADAMVLPSVSEGLANAWIEALACGTRLVICEAGGSAEVVTSDTSGYVVERNVGAIKEGIETLLETPRKRLDVAATVDRFSWSENGRNLAEYYDRLVSD
jgi:glycosyltransferase involved in cell wall biosynthesis